MATSQLQAVIDQLLARLTARLEGNSDVTVYDGYGVSGNTTDFLWVGLDTPASYQAALAGTSSQSDATMGTPRSRDERGTVTCAAYAVRGGSVTDPNANQKAARDAVYGYLAELEAELRDHPELGLGPNPDGPNTVAYLKAEIGDSRLSQNQNTQGADALLVFTVRYFARI